MVALITYLEQWWCISWTIWFMDQVSKASNSLCQLPFTLIKFDCTACHTYQAGQLIQDWHHAPLTIAFRSLEIPRGKESRNNYVAAPHKQQEPSDAKFLCNEAHLVHPSLNDSCYVSYIYNKGFKWQQQGPTLLAMYDTATTGASNACIKWRK
jgi:hypothetical protein